MFKEDFIEKVRESSNIVDIVGEHTTFRKTGSNLMGCCPLPGHNERTPSFSVSETKQLYHCFGCGRSGNIFDALRELKGFNFPESVEFLAGRAGIPIPEDSKQKNSNSASRDLRVKLQKINEIAAKMYNDNLVNLSADHAVSKYCASRGLTAEIISEFNLGYAYDQWDGLISYLGKKNTPMKDVRELGLIRPRKEGKGDYDLFRHRLMFPIQDHRGGFVGFGGRALDDEQAPKYLNSHESEIFKKGSTFYGLHQSQKHISTKDAVVVVEGYMDFLALYGAGIKNVVATLGTALTPQHAKLLKRHTRNIVILFDGDEAGARAAKRSLPILLAEGLVPKGVILKDQMDPDDFIKAEGVEALRKILIQAPELFYMQLRKEMESFGNGSSEKLRIMDELTPLMNAISDSRLKGLYAEEVAGALGVELNWVLKALDSAPKKQPDAAEAVGITEAPLPGVKHESAKIRIAKGPKAEVLLLNLALESPNRMKQIWASEILGEMLHPGVQELLVKAFEFCGQNSSKFDSLTAYLMTLTDPPSMVTLLSEPQFIGMKNEELDRMQMDCINKIRSQYLKNKGREFKARMRSLSVDEQLVELERFMNVHKANKTPKSITEPDDV